VKTNLLKHISKRGCRNRQNKAKRVEGMGKPRGGRENEEVKIKLSLGPSTTLWWGR
jgi:hypothetical protein